LEVDPKCSTCELCRTKFDHPNFGDQCISRVSASTLCSTRSHAPTMGNSVSPGLGNSANHGLRDVRLADPSKKVEKPAEILWSLIGSHRMLIGSHTNNFQSRPTLTMAPNGGAEKLKMCQCRVRRRTLPYREEPGSPRTRCTTCQARTRTPTREFDGKFDRKIVQEFDRKFDVDPIEKFDIRTNSNSNSSMRMSKQFAKFDRETLTRTHQEFGLADPRSASGYINRHPYQVTESLRLPVGCRNE